MFRPAKHVCVWPLLLNLGLYFNPWSFCWGLCFSASMQQLVTLMILSYQVSPSTTRKASSTGSAPATAPSIDATWMAMALRCWRPWRTNYARPQHWPSWVRAMVKGECRHNSSKDGRRITRYIRQSYLWAFPYSFVYAMSVPVSLVYNDQLTIPLSFLFFMEIHCILPAFQQYSFCAGKI